MTLYDEIIGFLPSADLKAKIAESGHRFSEEEQLRIICRYVPSFDQRLQMLERFSAVCAPDVSALAKLYIAYEQRMLAEFAAPVPGVVYELCIKESPDAWEEKYLCASYHAALVCIDRYYEEYADIDIHETEATRYVIKKRRIFSENDAFHADDCGRIVLGPRKTVLNVSVPENDSDCDGMCSECKRMCPHKCVDDDLFFPCFAHDQAIIRYRDPDLTEHFGICLCRKCEACVGLAPDLFVVPFDSSTVRDHRFDDDFYVHEHIVLPLAELAGPEELDDIARRNYFAFIAYLGSGK